MLLGFLVTSVKIPRQSIVIHFGVVDADLMRKMIVAAIRGHEISSGRASFRPYRGEAR